MARDISDEIGFILYQLSTVWRDVNGQRRSAITYQSGYSGPDDIVNVFQDSQNMMKALDKMTDAVLLQATLSIPFNIPTTVKVLPGTALSDFGINLHFKDPFSSTGDGPASVQPQIYLPAVPLAKLLGDRVNPADADFVALQSLFATSGTHGVGYYAASEQDVRPTLVDARLAPRRTTAHNRSR